MLRIKLIKSPIANTPRNRATVRGLGLKKMNQVVDHNDTPAIRGMIHHVKHLLSVEVVEGEAPSRKVFKGNVPVDASKPKAAKAKATPAPKAEVKAEAEAKPKTTRAKKKTEEETTESKEVDS